MMQNTEVRYHSESGKPRTSSNGALFSRIIEAGEEIFEGQLFWNSLWLLPGLPGKNKMKNRGVQGDAVVVNDFWVADTNGCERLRPLWKIVRTQRREETRRQRRTGYTIL
jgi:hypothetical protein